jgi:hypothetical protein
MALAEAMAVEAPTHTVDVLVGQQHTARVEYLPQLDQLLVDTATGQHFEA